LIRRWECPEATWKARILIRSAQDADTDLRAKLDAYERTLSSMASELLQQANSDGSDSNSNRGKKRKEKQASELRISQTSFSKMKRDYSRSHTTLDAYLSLHEKRQKAEIDQLHAISWRMPRGQHGQNGKGCKGPRADDDTTTTDFFDQAMRQRDLDRIHESMRTVSGIYEHLAGLVNSQQDQVDSLEGHVDRSKASFEAAAENLHCLVHRFECRTGRSVV
jgi:t-SNARE complex subunit (syntaxin)